MRLIFAGTPELAAEILGRLISFAQVHQHEIVAVLTQADRPAGRGQKLIKSPVKVLAEQQGLSLFQPISLKAKKDPQIQETLKNLKPDLIIVAAYGLLLPQAVLDIPRFGAWNVHVSLLPRWRGAAPIQRAIEAGDTESGVCLMQMDAGLDTGNILGRKVCPIHSDDTAEILHHRLAELGSVLLLETLTELAKHEFTPGFHLPREVQNHADATYAHKIEKAEGQIDWSQPMLALHHKIMAFNPWPVCFCEWKEQVIRLWTSSPTSLRYSDPPGTFICFDQHRLGVVTGDQQLLEILTLQLPNKKVMSAREFLNGHWA